MYTILMLIREMLSLSIPAIIVFTCFQPYRKRALDAMGLKSSIAREIGLILLVASIFSVLAVTLWPVYQWEGTTGSNALWGDLTFLINRPSWDFDVNLIPFKTVLKYIEAAAKGPSFVFWSLLNFCGNLAVFIPIGFFASLLFRGATWKRAVLIGFPMSLVIEICQWFIVRNVDIDDVILNTAGAVCGYLIYRLVRHVWPAVTQKFLCSSTSK